MAEKTAIAGGHATVVVPRISGVGRYGQRAFAVPERCAAAMPKERLKKRWQARPVEVVAW